MRIEIECHDDNDDFRSYLKDNSIIIIDDKDSWSYIFEGSRDNLIKLIKDYYDGIYLDSFDSLLTK
jgi:hypothetical protein